MPKQYTVDVYDASGERIGTSFLFAKSTSDAIIIVKAGYKHAEALRFVARRDA